MSSHIDVPTDEACAFCDYFAGRRPFTILTRSRLTATLVTREQRGRSHLLVIPTAHRETILDLTPEEADSVMAAVIEAARVIDMAEKGPGIGRLGTTDLKVTVRKNPAADSGHVGRSTPGDPWEALFEAARQERPEGFTDIVSYWVYTGEGAARIERYVPALPLSRDRIRADALKRAVASYRLAFGQPRQEDLLAYLAGAIDPEELERLSEELKINLAP